MEDRPKLIRKPKLARKSYLTKLSGYRTIPGTDGIMDWCVMWQGRILPFRSRNLSETKAYLARLHREGK